MRFIENQHGNTIISLLVLTEATLLLTFAQVHYLTIASLLSQWHPCLNQFQHAHECVASLSRPLTTIQLEHQAALYLRYCRVCDSRQRKDLMVPLEILLSHGFNRSLSVPHVL
jgi:hypothetical protein